MYPFSSLCGAASETCRLISFITLCLPSASPISSPPKLQVSNRSHDLTSHPEATQHTTTNTPNASTTSRSIDMYEFHSKRRTHINVSILGFFPVSALSSPVYFLKYGSRSRQERPGTAVLPRSRSPFFPAHLPAYLFSTSSPKPDKPTKPKARKLHVHSLPHPTQRANLAPNQVIDARSSNQHPPFRPPPYDYRSY